MEVETRVAALNVVGCTLAYKKKTVVKHKIMPGLTAKVMEACADADADGALTDDDDDEISVHHRAGQVLHTLGIHVPSKHAVPAILEQVTKAYSVRAHQLDCESLTSKTTQ